MSRTKAAVAAGVVVFLAGSALVMFVHVREPQRTPALRGAQVADELGCFACHGPRGTGGVPNPGSEVEEVPAWDGGTAMMYVKNEQEIREWILYGRPKRLEDEESQAFAGDSEAHGDENDVHDRSSLLPLRMLAFENVISENQLDDLVAYYKAVAAFETLPPRAREGYEAASRLGCYGCHGPGGRVGSNNPRSFKGYIPPWHGRDFAELVKNEEELRRWILDGKIDRFQSNPVARYFVRRQAIQMPAYRDVLRDGELEGLVTYVHWLNEESETQTRLEGRQ